MYLSHLVAIQPPPPPHPIVLIQFHQLHPDAQVKLEYDGIILVQVFQLYQDISSPQAHQSTHHKLIQHVQAARAVHPTPATHKLLPLLQLFPFLITFAVPVRVKVPSTYIAYPAGSSVIPVFTVRLL